MFQALFKRALFLLFLLVFSCSECQQQSKDRALNWINRNYGQRVGQKDKFLFNYALKLESGIKSRKDVIENCSAYPTLNVGDVDRTNNCIKLMQCALLFRGYYVGPINGAFDKRTASAVMQFKKDVFGDGVIVNSTVSPIFLLAIVDVGDYRLSDKGDFRVRQIQQYLNRNYARRCNIIPTDGEKGRRTHFTLVQGIQIEAGCEKIDGRFGQELTDLYSTLSKGMRGRMVYLMQCALYLNGIRININGVYDGSTVIAVKKFQAFMRLPQTGVADLRTMKGLLISTGDVTRPAIACDSYFRLSADATKALHNAGYRFVGRYLTGSIKGFRGKLIPKFIDRAELQAISNAGMRAFLIFQEKGGHDIETFTTDQGIEDAKIAVTAVRKLGVSQGATIYFSVDCDPSNKQINQKIIPYFRAVNRIVRKCGYSVGVYGTRLVCTLVSDAGYARHSFVSDYSPLFNGNLGYPLPKNWAFDQFHELKGKEMFKYSGGKFNLDKVIASGRDRGVAYYGNGK